MNYYPRKIIFPFTQNKNTHIVYDISYVTDLTKYSKLINFCMMVGELVNLDKYEDWNHFQLMTETAIRFNNIKSLQTLWQTIIDNNGNPNYGKDLEIAAQFGNLKTLQHCINAIMVGKFSAYEIPEGVSIEKLLYLAKYNSDKNIVDYIELIKPIFIKYSNSEYINKNDDPLYPKIQFIVVESEECIKELKDDDKQVYINDKMLFTLLHKETVKFNKNIKI